MKLKKSHITILSLLIWRFFSEFSILFIKSERIAKQKFFLIFLFFSFTISFSQQYTNYSTKDGLPSNHVYTITQDAKGFIWFLTDKGMVKYNGETFKTFTTKNGLPNNDVWEAYPTPDGKIWYMSKSTKLGYIENDTVISFPNNNKDEIINPLYTSRVGDSIYPTGPRKTFTLKDGTWYGESNEYIEGTTDWVKIRHKDFRFMSFNRNREILNIYKEDFVKSDSILADNIYGKIGIRGQINDSLFYWSSNASYSILNLNTLEFKQYNIKESNGNSITTYSKINSINNSFQISVDGYVAKLDKDFKISNPLYFPQNLQSHFGFVDKSNTVWLATFNNGVYKLPYVKREVKYRLLNEKVQSFNIIDNNLIVGVYKKGFYTYNAKEKSFQQIIESNDYIFGASEVKPLNTSFYAFKHALQKEVNKKIETINLSGVLNEKVASNEVARKLVYFKGKLYGNFSFGIHRLNPDPLKIENKYTQKGCNDIIRFNNQLLVATTNGLKEIKKDTLVPVTFKNKALKKSILSLNVIDDTHLLINTDGFGSYITDMQSIKPLQQTAFLIVEEAFIEDNALWLATNSGVLKFEADNGSYNLSKTYTTSDGLPTNHINTIYVNNESLIVGTNNGIAIVPKHQENISQVVDVYIDKASYNNQDISASNSVFKYKSNNSLNVKISNIDFSDKEADFTYNYKLEPINKDWVTTTTNNFSFNNIQPGEYTLYITAKTIKKQLSFTIKPLWWQTFWFKILIGLLGIFLVAFISRFFVRRSQFKKNQKIFEDKRLSELQLKALRSQMNPHFVFNSLSAIQYYIGENDFESSETYLVKFSKLIRQFFELSKENEISLETEITLLNNYLEIEKLRFKDKLNFTIHVDVNLVTETTKIPTMLLQPIVENAVNHGVFNKMENGIVILNFIYIDAQSFKVEIIDDGVGFINTKKRKNKSVKSSIVLKDRLHFLNHSGKWEISHTEEEVYPHKKDKGNKSVFLIKKK
ncbi:histidine kinase [Oceanihabitans sp. 2_MG-2023]|uniref:sensor histidine kinase n=1 Tax=Oceanihabitans sp. 2_MG-2023 TaxID=3062661 RepID=UPI0026E2C511|nr:sensor histidine kinase [Oceanihabitans sp. 2_MG-2023]MDO6596923.1 histidine kinase [Oceanihabitans sp. 2_MG-2023]